MGQYQVPLPCVPSSLRAWDRREWSMSWCHPARSNARTARSHTSRSVCLWGQISATVPQREQATP
jgi:hypothetical protein